MCACGGGIGHLFYTDQEQEVNKLGGVETFVLETLNPVCIDKKQHEFRSDPLIHVAWPRIRYVSDLGPRNLSR